MYRLVRPSRIDCIVFLRGGCIRYLLDAFFWSVAAAVGLAAAAAVPVPPVLNRR